MSTSNGYGEEYGDDGYGGTDPGVQSNAAYANGPVRETGHAGRRGAADVSLKFQVSGMEILPLTFSARQDRGKDNWGRASMTKEASEYVADNVVHQEPVDIMADGDTFWRGYVRDDSVSVGHTTGNVELYDPLQLLENGMVDMEWTKTNLGDIVNTIWEECVYDPHGVFNGPTFPGADTSSVRQQHNFHPASYTDIPFTQLDEEIRNNLADTIPFVDGDGNFDFRGEPPREVFREIAEAFNVDMFTTPDRNLAFGFPDDMASHYSAGRSQSAWRMVGFDVPTHQDSFGKVIIKGVTPILTGRDPEGPAEGSTDLMGIPGRFIERADNTNHYGWAKMSGYDGPTTFMEYTKSDDPEVLKTVARRKLIQQFMSANTGEIEIDVLATQTGTADLDRLMLGDHITTIANEECGIRGGMYRINGIRHEYTPDVGWRMHLKVTGMFESSNIQTGSFKMNNIQSDYTNMSREQLVDQFT